MDNPGPRPISEAAILAAAQTISEKAANILEKNPITLANLKEKLETIQHNFEQEEDKIHQEEAEQAGAKGLWETITQEDPGNRPQTQLDYWKAIGKLLIQLILRPFKDIIQKIARKYRALNKEQQVKQALKDALGLQKDDPMTTAIDQSPDLLQQINQQQIDASGLQKDDPMTTAIDQSPDLLQQINQKQNVNDLAGEKAAIEEQSQGQTPSPSSKPSSEDILAGDELLIDEESTTSTAEEAEKDSSNLINVIEEDANQADNELLSDLQAVKTDLKSVTKPIDDLREKQADIDQQAGVKANIGEDEKEIVSPRLS